MFEAEITVNKDQDSKASPLSRGLQEDVRLTNPILFCLSQRHYKADYIKYSTGFTDESKSKTPKPM